MIFPVQRRIKNCLVLIIFFLSIFFLHNILYGQPQEILKFEADDTLEEIREKIEHNGYNFTVDHNWVYDMPPEAKKTFFRRRLPLHPRGDHFSDEIGPLAAVHLDRQLAAQFDWRNYNGHSYIGPIRDQGSCGSCYAFGASSAAEGTYNWAKDSYDENCADFSEAFIAFCLSDQYPGFDGCNGSDYDYEELDGLIDYGVCGETSYFYTDVEQECNSSSWNASRATFKSWHRIECGHIDAIKTVIMTYGVVDAAVLLTVAFQAYSNGVYEDANTACDVTPCYYTETDHVVALVGWDDNPPEGGGGCWILRNSWGTGWGEDGYMRIRYTSAHVACEAAYLVYALAPTITTGTATSVMCGSATLNGTVNPNNSSATCYFEYGKTTDYGLTTTSKNAGSGADNVSVSADIDGLTYKTTYHYQLRSENKFGVTYGGDKTFNTPAAPPTVTTGSSTSVTSFSATLGGIVNPNMESTNYYFEYGKTMDYGSATTSTDAGLGTDDVSVTAEISGLSSSTTYHFRLVATSSAGTTNGDVKTFTSISVEGGGGGGGCFIATAVYGSPMHPHVEVLREFRDRCLLATTPGKGFVDFYYNCSPPISDFIAKHNFLKVMVRCSLLPIVGFCYASLHFGITNAAIILFLVFVLSVIFFRAFLKTLYSRN